MVVDYLITVKRVLSWPKCLYTRAAAVFRIVSRAACPVWSLACVVVTASMRASRRSVTGFRRDVITAIRFAYAASWTLRMSAVEAALVAWRFSWRLSFVTDCDSGGVFLVPWARACVYLLPTSPILMITHMRGWSYTAMDNRRSNGMSVSDWMDEPFHLALLL